jgi:Mg2+/Co2+ transporter CorB
MTAHIVLELLFCALLLAASAFFSGSEAAFFSLKTWQLESARGGKPGFDLVLGLLKNPPLLLVCILMGNETVNVTLSFVSSSIRAELFPGAWGAALAVLVTSVLLILCGEALP